jgi:hypothetical protein
LIKNFFLNPHPKSCKVIKNISSFHNVLHIYDPMSHVQNQHPTYIKTKRCKWDTMSQWNYCKKGLHVLFVKKKISYEWILGKKKIVTCYTKCSYLSKYMTCFFSSFLNKYEFLKVFWFLVNSMFRFLKW